MSLKTYKMNNTNHKVNQLLLDLLNISSITGNEKEICDYVYNYLLTKGFSPKKIFIDENGYCIVVTIGTPKVYLSSHLDTVKEDIEIREDEDTIYGRGSCDAKGSVATMITAAIKCKEQEISDFGLILTIREESDFSGVHEVIKSIKEIPYVIVGEPTNLTLINKHHGIISFKIISRGKSVHSSHPENGINAIEGLLETVQRIKQIPLSDDTTLSLCKIKGGITRNIIPDYCEAELSLRINPNDSQDYLQKIKKLLDKNAQIEEIRELPGINTEIKKEVSFITKVSSARYLTELSVYKKGVVLGPGHINLAHTKNEKIKKSELHEAVHVYEEIIKNFCSCEKS